MITSTRTNDSFRGLVETKRHFFFPTVAGKRTVTARSYQTTTTPDRGVDFKA